MNNIPDGNLNDSAYQELVEKISREVLSQISTGEDKLKNTVKGSIVDILKKSKIHFRPSEIENIDITDYGLGDFYNIGLALIIYVNSARVCAKELPMTPYQICPQHRHPAIEKSPGKEETFRCRWGEVYLYTEGNKEKEIKGKIPEKYKDKFNVFHEIILRPGDQYTLNPDTWHWFQGGPEGAILSEFSTHSYDAGDIYYDKNIKRIAVDN